MEKDKTIDRQIKSICRRRTRGETFKSYLLTILIILAVIVFLVQVASWKAYYHDKDNRYEQYRTSNYKYVPNYQDYKIEYKQEVNKDYKKINESIYLNKALYPITLIPLMISYLFRERGIFKI